MVLSFLSHSCHSHMVRLPHLLPVTSKLKYQMLFRDFLVDNIETKPFRALWICNMSFMKQLLHSPCSCALRSSLGFWSDQVTEEANPTETVLPWSHQHGLKLGPECNIYEKSVFFQVTTKESEQFSGERALENKVDLHIQKNIERSKLFALRYQLCR